MTLSESQALDSFDFLGAEDAALLHRMSRVSFPEGPEGMYTRQALSAQYTHSLPLEHEQELLGCGVDYCHSTSHGYLAPAGLPLFGFSKDSLQRREEGKGEMEEEEEEEDEEDFGQPQVEGGTTGMRSVDIVLIQHLLHCEFLLQHLQVQFTSQTFQLLKLCLQVIIAVSCMYMYMYMCDIDNQHTGVWSEVGLGLSPCEMGTTVTCIAHITCSTCTCMSYSGTCTCMQLVCVAVVIRSP